MKVFRALLAIVALALANVAAAQFCSGGPPPNFAYLDYVPKSPDSTQSITITVGHAAFVLRGETTEVKGDAINVTQIGFVGAVGLPPPTMCSVVTVGPLAAGTYTVNYLLYDYMASFPPLLVASASVTVAPAAAASPIPTNTSVGLGLLALLLGAVGWLYLRSRPQVRSERVA